MVVVLWPVSHGLLIAVKGKSFVALYSFLALVPRIGIIAAVVVKSMYIIEVVFGKVGVYDYQFDIVSLLIDDYWLGYGSGFYLVGWLWPQETPGL